MKYLSIAYTLLLILFCGPLSSEAVVQVGAERLFSPEYRELLKGKRIGLVTNQTAIDKQMHHVSEHLLNNAKEGRYKVVAFFSPEHGFRGQGLAWEHIEDETHRSGIPIYSLHGSTRRPTEQMMRGIDLLIFDIQDIGSRSYTYLSTMCYCMEEAAKRQIPFIVLDRPNPINGLIIDGPMLETRRRSFVGYINVPYCHGMTSGELAQFFNAEYKVGCNLTVIPMEGWQRHMTFTDTGLPWVPTSPQIPEADSPLFYPTTGILGELQMVSIGIGYTLPFKVVGAPWVNSRRFAEALNKQNFPGVQFMPFYFRPFYGRFKQQDCGGVLIHITDHTVYKPVSTQYLLIGVLKSLYPQEFKKALEASANRKEMFGKVNGTDEIYRIISRERYIVWKLRAVHEKERQQFAEQRKPYLIPSYGAPDGNLPSPQS